MRHLTKKAALLALLTVLSFEAAAQAFIELDTIPTIFGLGVGTVPDYRGSDDNTTVIAPYFRHTFSRSDRYIQLNATTRDKNP